MRKLLITVIAAAAMATLLAACSGDGADDARAKEPAKPVELTKAQLIAKVKRGIGKVFVESEFQGETSGSGILIDKEKGLFLTNAHNVRGFSAIKVRFPDSREKISATPLGISDCNGDLAVLKLRTVPENAHALAFAPEGGFEVGDEVGIGGFEGTLRGWNVAKPSFSFGVISDKDIRRANLGPDVARGQGALLQTSARSGPGASGSPVFNMKGEVVAVTTYGSGEGQVYGYQSEVVRAAIPDLVAGKSGTTGVQTVPTSTIDMGDVYHAMGAPRRIADAFGRIVEKRGGLLVVGANANSPADVKGLRFMHVIEKMNGLRVNNMTQHCDVLGSTSTVKMEGYDASLDHRFFDDFTRRVKVK